MGIGNIILDPSEVAIEGRTELPLEGGGISIYYEGLDFGDQEIRAYMAEGLFGSTPIDHDWPLRTIKIPLVIRKYGTETFDDIRVKLEAKIARINEDGGGWLKRILPSGRHIFADLVEAKLHLSASWLAENRNIDREATLELQALPDYYGDRIELAAFKGTGDASESFQVDGNLPGRLDLSVTNESTSNQLGLAYHLRRKNYSADDGAAWTYEAEDLTPLDLATIATVSGASPPPGSGEFNAVTHSSLSTNWTPVLSTNRLPKVRGVGAVAASTGKITLALPAGVKENDILMMFIETENQAVTVPTGWAHVSGSPIEVASGTLTRLTVLWKRVGANEVAPTVEDPGDHIIGRIMAVSGCIKSGNPWDVKATGTELVSDTSVEVPGATTTVDGCLIIAAAATGTDVSSSTHISGWTNANLQALTERMDSWTAEGSGGGFGVATGVKLKAGAYGATTATVGTANFKALMSFALKPETGGNFLKHTGLYDVWARVYTTNKEEPLPWLRLLSDVGDLVSPSENQQVQIPISEAFCLVPLGQVNLRTLPFGEQRWLGTVQARGEKEGQNVYIDKLWFLCGDEASGILKASLLPTQGLSPFKARDGFNQAKAALNGLALPDGSGKWLTEGSTKGDYETSGSGTLVRAIGTDTTYRLAVAPGGPYSSVVAAQLSWKWSAIPASLKSTHSLWSGLIFGTSGAGEMVAHSKQEIGGVIQPELLKFCNQRITFPWTAGVRYTFTMLITAAFSAGWVTKDGEAPSGPPTITSGTVAAELIPAIIDRFDNEEIITRTFDDFAVWIPAVDAAAFASRNTRISTNGVYRQSEDGLSYGPVTYPGSDLPRIPVSGPEGRPVEVAVKTSRGEFANLPDSGLDKLAVQPSYRPCWSEIPDS